MARGRLRVYLGVAPGAGTTHALLAEARRRQARGTDVVIGSLETHDRPGLGPLADGVERVGPGDRVAVEALLARRPAVVLVDDLPRDNPAGARHAHRWQDAEELLEAGIDVVATLDVRGIASLADVVERITGRRPGQVVPDRLLHQAEQLELVDITPQALRRRLAHGGLHAPEDVDAALAASFAPSILAALRELALAWAAGVVPRQHATWVERVDPTALPQTADVDDRERLVVALSGGAESERLLHRAARLAARSLGAELHAVHVLSGRRPGEDRPGTDRLRELAAAVGATYQQVIGQDVAASVLAVAHAERATQLVVGADRPADGWPPPWRPAGAAARILAAAGDLDVHVVTSAAAGPAARMPPLRAGLPTGRRVAGFGLAVVGPAILAAGLQVAGEWVGLAGDSLLLLLAVVVTALVGGLWPALLSAVVASTLLNFYFIPPVHTFRVSEPHNVITLIVFVLVAGLVGAVVHRAATLAGQAARAAAESRTLSAVAEGILRGEEALPSLLEQVRAAFGMRSAGLLQRDGAQAWQVVHARGSMPPQRPEEADVQVPAGADLVLALAGHPLAAADRTVLRAFAAQAQGLLERDRLARGAAVAARLEATERLRDALLAAVGHDLRTPLASATAAVSSLRSTEVDWSAREREELLATAEESLARLARLVADLLDLSRLRAGVLTVASEPVWLDELIPPALDELGPEARAVRLQVPDELPAVLADAALVTRALVNVAGNALRYSPKDRPPLVSASAGPDRVEVRVVDRGPGIPPQDRERVFTPFQRQGDTDNRAGLGLGLALSRGLIEAMGGTLEAEDTPGGGLTMVITLPRAPAAAGEESAQPGQREREAPAS